MVGEERILTSEIQKKQRAPVTLHNKESQHPLPIFQKKAYKKDFFCLYTNFLYRVFFFFLFKKKGPTSRPRPINTKRGKI